MKKEKHDKHVPVDFSLNLPELQGEGGQALMTANHVGIIPVSFDRDFVEKELAIIAGRPSAVSNYFASLRARFNLREQVRIINAMEERYKALVTGMQTQIEAVRLQREYIIALAELRSVEEDLEVSRLRRQSEKEALLLDIEKKKQERTGLMKYQDYRIKKREEMLKDLREKTRHSTEMFIAQKLGEMERLKRLEEVKQQEIKACTEEYFRRYGASAEGELPNEAKQAMQETIEDIEDFFNKAKASGK